MRIFVYGTLKKGQRLHKIFNLHNATSLGDARARGLVVMEGPHGSGAPVAFFGKGIVYGEVYEVSRGVGEAISKMEVAAGYRRVRRTVDMAKGQVVEVTLWVGSDEEKREKVKCGWKEVRGGSWRG